MKIKAIALAVFAAGLFASSSASAELFYGKYQLRYVEEVFVFVHDAVEGGCLPRPNTLKVEAELILRRSGIKVLEEATQRSHTLQIGPIGGPTTSYANACFGALQIKLFRAERLRDGTVGLVKASDWVSAHIQPKPVFEQQLRETVNEAVTGLANEILKARQNAE